MTNTYAIRCADFIGSQGVNIKTQATGSPYLPITNTLTFLQYLGVSNVRDQYGNTTITGSPPATWITLMNAGINFLWCMPEIPGDRATNSFEAVTPTEAETTATYYATNYPGRLLAIEGENECNGAPYANSSPSGAQFPSLFNTWEQNTYNLVKGSGTTSSILVVNYSINNTLGSPFGGNNAAFVDRGCIHEYVGQQPPSGAISGSDINFGLTAVGKNLFVTETGYSDWPLNNLPSIGPTDAAWPYGYGIPQAYAAQCMLQTYLDWYVIGLSPYYSNTRLNYQATQGSVNVPVTNTFLYELANDTFDPQNSNHENHFGLFNYDGSPKQAATIIRNFNAIIADTGASKNTFTTTALNYTVSTNYIFTALMQKSTDTTAFYLVVYVEVDPYQSGKTATLVTPTPTTTGTVSFGQTFAHVNVYDPNQSQVPIQATSSNISSITLTWTTCQTYILELLTTLSALSATTVNGYQTTATTTTIAANAARGGTPPYTYQFQRAPDVSGSPGTFVNIGAPTTSVVYSDSNLSQNTKYWYRYSVTDSASASATSASNYIKTTQYADVIYPGCTVSNISATGFTMSTTAPTGGSGSFQVTMAYAPDYTVQGGNIPQIFAEFNSINTGNTLSVTMSNASNHPGVTLAAGLQYWVRSLFYDNNSQIANYGPYSSFWTPAASSGLSLLLPPTLAVSGTNVTVTTTAAQAGSGTGYTYQFQRAPNNFGVPGTWTNIGSAQTGLTYTDTGLTSNTTYFYRTKVTDSASHTAQGGTNQATTGVASLPALTTGTITFPSGTSTSYVLQANNTTGGTGAGTYSYQFQRAPDNSGVAGTFANVGSGGSSPTYNDTGLSILTYYWWQVIVTDGAGNTITSAAARNGTPSNPIANTPTNLVAVSASQVTGTSMFGGGGYGPSWTMQVQRSLTSGGTYTNVGSQINVGNFTDNTVVGGTTYYYRVMVYDSVGDVSTSGSASVTTPAVSGALSIAAPAFTSVGQTTLSVVSQVATGGTPPYNYQFQRAPSVGGAPSTFTNIGASQTTLTYADSALTANTQYFYRVVVTDSATPTTDTTTSPNAAQTTQATNLVANNVTVSGQTQSALTLNTTAPTGGVSPYNYQFQQGLAQGGPFTNVGPNSSALSYTSSGLNPNTTYYFVVTVTDNNGTTSTSSSASGTTLTALTVGAITFSNINTTTLTVSCPAALGGSGNYLYQFRRATSGSGPFTNVGPNSSATIYNDTGLSALTTYYYDVIVMDSQGDSAISQNSQQTTDAPIAIGAPTFSAYNATSITVVSPAASGGSGAGYTYQFQRSTSSGGTYTNVGSASSALSYVDSGLSVSTAYYYKVTVVDSGSNTVTSAISTQSTSSLPTAAIPTVSAVSSSTLTLTETASTGGVPPYTYQFQQNSANIGLASSSLVYNVTGLSPSTSYTFRVIVTDAGGNTTTSATVAQTTASGLGVGVVVVSAETSTSLTLTSPIATGGTAPYTYQFQRAANVGGAPGTYSNIGTSSTSTTTSLSSLTPSTTYWFRVIVTDAVAATGVATGISTTTLAAIVNASISVSSITYASALLNGAGTGGTLPYTYQQLIGRTSTGPFITVGTTQSYNATGLNASTTYWVETVVTDATGVVGVSAPVSFVTSAIPTPPAPGVYPDNQGNPAGNMPVYVTSGAFGGGPAPYRFTPLGYQQITSLSTAQHLTVPNGAVFAVLTVTGAGVSYRDDGVVPTASTGDVLGQNLQLIYAGSLAAVQFIQQSAGAVLNISYYR